MTAAVSTNCHLVDVPSQLANSDKFVTCPKTPFRPIITPSLREVFDSIRSLFHPDAKPFIKVVAARFK